MNIHNLTLGGASALVIATILAGPMLAPAHAADTPCTAAKSSDNAGAPAQAPASGSSTTNDQKPVPDGFGHLVTPGYGTTVPGTPSELAAERKKGDKTADAKDAASDPSCK